MEDYELDRARQYAVCKSNDLIQKAKFALTAIEQKIIWYLISKIKPEDTELQTYRFSITEFFEICGSEENNSGNIAYVKDVIMKLYSKRFWFKISSTKNAGGGWIDEPIIDSENKTIELKINKYLREHLVGLKDIGIYTTLDLTVALALTSKYSIRLYEVLKSFENLGKCHFKLDNLKAIINGEKYVRHADFRKNILEIAIPEINIFADFRIEYTLIKTGKKYTDIYFTFKKKSQYQHYKAIKLIDERLNIPEKQLTF